jgi:hypothetical protein
LVLKGGEQLDNIAIIKINEDEAKYELFIGGKLKAYTTGITEDHKKELVKLVEDKGYIVKFEE